MGCQRFGIAQNWHGTRLKGTDAESFTPRERRAPPPPLQRFSSGNSASSQEALTEEWYMGAFRYSAWDTNRKLPRTDKFPLVDFQKGNNLVSLKTVDTTGSAWLNRSQAHIDDLASGRATVNGNRPNMILDLRVQPGGRGVAQRLIEYGRQQGVSVIIKEFP
jgi:hypothetical protein